MVGPGNYQNMAAGEWRLLALANQWNSDVQNRVLELVRSRKPARHPQTLETRLTVGGTERVLYLKIFGRAAGLPALKDMLRQSKAFRFWRQGIALRDSGFNAPLTIAVGEQRRCRLVQRAFVLTEGIVGEPIPDFLGRQIAWSADRETLARKREAIRLFAALVRRFHQSGFVHGDMVASNILVVERACKDLKFYFMDNDRTRRFPSWFSKWLWTRNLVQLNRMPLPGISLQDRMRFLRAYLGADKFSVADRKLAQWLEVKTRQRRKECDGVDPAGNFRELMRWSPELNGAKNLSTKIG